VGKPTVDTGAIPDEEAHLEPSSPAAPPVGATAGARERSQACLELNAHQDARYTVALEWDRNTGETQIAVGDSGTSSLLVFPVVGEKAGDAFRHPFRYAP